MYFDRNGEIEEITTWFCYNILYTVDKRYILINKGAAN